MNAQQASSELHALIVAPRDHQSIEIQQLRIRNNDLQNDNRDLRGDNQGLRAENQSLRTENQSLRTENQNWRENTRQLADQLREALSLHRQPEESVLSNLPNTRWTTEQGWFGELTFSGNASLGHVRNLQPLEPARPQEQSAAVNMTSVILNEVLDNRAPQPTSSASTNVPRGNPVATINSSLFPDTLDPSVLQVPGQTGRSVFGSGWSDDTLLVEGDNEKSMEWGPQARDNPGRAQRDVNYGSY
jgi:FtsZ-binding cell division protein ZapB